MIPVSVCGLFQNKEQEIDTSWRNGGNKYCSHVLPFVMEAIMVIVLYINITVSADPDVNGS